MKRKPLPKPKPCRACGKCPSTTADDAMCWVTWCNNNMADDPTHDLAAYGKTRREAVTRWNEVMS